jgi:hypothetical protein
VALTHSPHGWRPANLRPAQAHFEFELAELIADVRHLPHLRRLMLLIPPPLSPWGGSLVDAWGRNGGVRSDVVDRVLPGIMPEVGVAAAVEVVPIHSVFWDRIYETWPSFNLYLADGVHLTGDGSLLIASTVARVLGRPYMGACAVMEASSHGGPLQRPYPINALTCALCLHCSGYCPQCA